MVKLERVTERTQYIASATNIGIYSENGKEAWIIDTGIDADMGKKILKALDEEGLKVRGIICTHSHSDHIGGNNLIVSRTECTVLAHGIERAIAENPIINSSCVYGGCPHKAILNKFFYSEPFGNVTEVDGNLPEGLSYFLLPGHTFDMIGIKTSDNVYFLADSLIGRDIIEKYQFFYLKDIKAQLDTLDYLSEIVIRNKKDGVPAVYIPSHSQAEDNIEELIDLNRKKILELLNLILNKLVKKKSIEQLIQELFDDLNLKMSLTQNVLVTSTVRSYLTFLINEDKVQTLIEDNILYFEKK